MKRGGVVRRSAGGICNSFVGGQGPNEGSTFMSVSQVESPGGKMPTMSQVRGSRAGTATGSRPVRPSAEWFQIPCEGPVTVWLLGP